MTKKNAGLLATYNAATATDLYQVYGRPSRNKWAAFHACKRLQAALNGYDGRIPSASCHFFSYAFRYKDGDNEKLIYMTGRNNYEFTIE